MEVKSICAGEAARTLGVSAKALEMKRRKHTGPPFIRVNKKPYYHPDMLEIGSYARSGEVKNFAEAAHPSIAAATTPPEPPTTTPAPTNLTPDHVFDLIEEWERAEIAQARVDSFKGKVAPLSRYRKHKRSEELYELQQPGVAKMLDPKFKTKLRSVLNLERGHPVLDHNQVHFWFRQAWLAIERAKDRFAIGDFS